MTIKNVYRIPSDLLIMLIWTLLTVIFILTPILENTFIRTILGLPFVLFIPGYVLIAALFPKKDDLDSIERIALSFGLSIAVVPLIGLGLNFTFGIRLFQILASLSIYIFLMILASIYRRNEIPIEQRFDVSFKQIIDTIKFDIKTESKLDRILTIILIFSIIAAIGMLIYVIVTPKIGEKFTEFYILGKNGKADNYPTKLINGTEENITVGVVNHEYVPINYTVEIKLDNISLKKENLYISNNETWEKNISYIPNNIINDTKLEFQLFRENNFTAPYRDLHLWVNVTEKQPEIVKDEDE